MQISNKREIFIGLSGVEMSVPSFDFGDGLIITKTYAHLMSPFLMAFKPAQRGKPHPGPWKAAQGGGAFDIHAELRVPANAELRSDDHYLLARTFIFLIRIGINPAATLSVISDHSFSSLPKVIDNEVLLVPFEIHPRYFSLEVENGLITEEALEWIKNHWKITYQFMNESPEFALAVEAIEGGQFIRQPELAMLSLWAALEALFSPSTMELSFRVSSLIASYLEPPGRNRLELQKEIVKLYSKRSAAAHGKSKHNNDDLLATFNLLRNILVRIIDEGSVPTKESLEKNLFGDS